MQTKQTLGSGENLQMVRGIAGAMGRRLPPSVDKDELLSLGYLGLVEAQERFDPARGVPFGAFAAVRVRGAMLDWLRQRDPITRSERARLRLSGETASVTLVDFACAENQPAPGGDAGELLLASERRALLNRAINTLSARDRLVVQRHFFDEQPLRQIGKELKVSESRVCQLVGEVVARLRTLLAGDLDLDMPMAKAA